MEQPKRQKSILHPGLDPWLRPPYTIGGAVILLLVLAGTALATRAGAPRLGATRAEVTALLGAPWRATSDQALYRCPGSTVLAWMIGFDEGGGNRVTSLVRQRCSGSFTYAEAIQEASPAFPQDAKKVGPFSSDDGTRALAYRSVSLARLLPRTTMRACSGKATPGSFSFAVTAAGESWVLAAGLCP